LVIALSVFLNTFNVYRVSSESMIPALLPFDYVLVRKIKKNSVQNGAIACYGKVYIISLPYLDSIKKECNSLQENSLYVKRIVGLPGDTLQIVNKTLLVNSLEKLDNKQNMNPNSLDKIRDVYDYGLDYKNYNNITNEDNDNFGPFYIPHKNHKMEIMDSLFFLYKNIISYEASNNPEIKIYVSDCYTFQNNYYFVLGDNRNFSIDSRHFGPIPESAIIGEAKYVLFSWSKHKPFFISRILKKIK